MTNGITCLVTLIGLGLLHQVDGFPKVPQLRSAVPWLRSGSSPGSQYVGTVLNFDFPPDFLRCSDEYQDLIMIVHSPCDMSLLVQHALRHCQSKTSQRCHENVGKRFTQPLQSCFESASNPLVMVYYCIPKESQYNICGQTHEMTSREPSAFIYTGASEYIEEKPCVCTVSEGASSVLTVYNFHADLDAQTQLHINKDAFTSHTEFDGLNGFTEIRGNGHTIWLSGKIAPVLFITGLFSAFPLEVTCGLQNIGLILTPPVVASLHATNATVTCSFRRTVEGWPLEKFGLAFSTATSEDYVHVNELQNAFYCERGTLLNDLLLKRFGGTSAGGENSVPLYSTAYQVANEPAQRRKCEESTFQGDLSFTISLTIAPTLPFDPQAKWHCFYELFDWVQVSIYAPVPFPALKDIVGLHTISQSPIRVTSSTPFLTESSGNSGQTGNTNGTSESVIPIGTDEEVLPTWVIPVVITGSSLLVLASSALLYGLHKSRQDSDSSVEASMPLEVNADTLLQSSVQGTITSHPEMVNTFPLPPGQSRSTPVSTDVGMFSGRLQSAASPARKSHRRRHSDVGKRPPGIVEASANGTTIIEFA